MAVSNTIDIILNAKGSAQVARELERLKRELGGLQGFANTLNRTLSTLGMGLGVAGFVGAIRQSVRAAQEAATSLAGLRTALDVTGQMSERNLRAFREQASALQSVAGAADTTVFAVQRMFLSMGASAEQAFQLTPLVLDLAAAMGTDALSAARQLGRAFEGEEVVISRLNIRARDFNDLLNQLNARVRGQAQAFNEAMGPMGNYETAVSKLQGSVGTLVVSGLNPFVDALARTIDGIDRLVSKMSSGGLPALITLLAKQTTDVKALNAISAALDYVAPRSTATTPEPSTPTPGPGVTAASTAALRESISLRLRENQLITEKYLIENREAPELSRYLREQLDIERALIQERRQATAEALAAGVIDDEQARKNEIEDKRELLRIERERLALAASDAASIREELTRRIEQTQIVVEQQAITARNVEDLNRVYREQLLIQRDLVYERQRGTEAALAEGAITNDEALRQRIEDERELLRIRRELAALAHEENPLIGGFAIAMERFGTVTQQVGDAFSNIIGGAIDSISDGISGLILQTLSWGQALQRIGVGILTTLVRSVVQFFVQLGVQRLLAATVGTSIAAAEAATLASLWAGPAVLASIATAGGAAAAGPPAVAAALASAPALGAAASVAGFQEGGYTGDAPPDQVAGVVHGREFVFSAPAVERIGLPVLTALHEGRAVAAALASVPGFREGGYTGDAPPDQVASVVRGREFVFPAPTVEQIGLPALTALHEGRARVGGGDEERPMQVVIVDNRRDADELRRDPRFRTAVIDLMERGI